jgi:hypothetical protein
LNALNAQTVGMKRDEAETHTLPPYCFGQLGQTSELDCRPFRRLEARNWKCS